LIRPTTFDDSLFATARGFGQLPTLPTLLERLFEERFYPRVQDAGFIGGQVK